MEGPALSRPFFCMKVKMSMVPLMFALVVFFTSISVFANDEPWESVDCSSPRTAFNLEPRLQSSLLRTTLTFALDAYQTKQSEKTVHRCAFYTSCSAFLPRAIDVYGLPLGFLAFMDRYLYRENKSAFKNYPLRRRSDGVYKLDDEPFLAP